MIVSKRILSTSLVASAFLVTGSLMAQTKMKTLELSDIKATFMVPSDAVSQKTTAYDYIMENDDFQIFVAQDNDEEFTSTLEERMKDDGVSAKTKIQTFSNENIKASFASAITEEDGEKELKMYINAQSIKNPNSKIEMDIIAYEVNENTIKTANDMLNSLTFLDAASYNTFAKKSSAEKVQTLNQKVEGTASKGIGKSLLSTALNLAADFIPGGSTIKGLLGKFLGN